MIDKDTFNNRTALFHTLGCKLNFAETSTIARLFAERGINRVQRGDVPDIVVVNTCSVTDLADKKDRQAIRRLVKKYPEATVIVTGCYAQLRPEEVAAIDGVDIVAGNDKKNSLPDYLDSWMQQRQKATHHVDFKQINEFTPSCSRGDRTRYFLKVQDGCDYYCSYCTIPMARGRSRSGTIEQIVAQARQAASEGGKEIVLTGVNVGDFGRHHGETFLDLIKQLDKVDGIERYRISSIEPNLLTPEIVEFVAESRRFMPSFHIPLQNGNDEVLKLMRRRYDSELFASRVDLIRCVMPDAFIGVDLIVGARGETEERFESSRRFVEGLDISRLHVFTYSERPDTRALSIDHVVDQAEKHRRTRIMLAVSEKKLEAFTSRFIGSVRPVLVEHRRRDGLMSGLTDNYLRVAIDGDNVVPNSVVSVKIGTYDPTTEESRGEVVL
ncbi:MAG: tRNA (N(6)-L-threonylcarbamoyladenosine(37)-C(2))-methylthiotransferase MtaB [Muribaculaceae bacterium]|nr:tRNA (N(6)-L-threonylcarbamoyladenosine(37)-C(2))-methylthiotransferase MtaB [Muribaculaceae bacterium]